MSQTRDVNECDKYLIRVAEGLTNHDEAGREVAMLLLRATGLVWHWERTRHYLTVPEIRIVVSRK